MSHLKYFDYGGVSLSLKQFAGHSQAVRVGNQIHISGQGGWDPINEKDIVFKPTTLEQIDQAFENVDITLKAAGGKGWEQVFSVRSFHLGPLSPEVTQRFKANMEKWMPNHAPIWTEIGVASLGALDMKVEIEVVAHLGDED